MFLLERLVDVVAPHQCISCGQEGSLVCAWCKPDACQPIPERCYKCQKYSLNSAVCKNCRKRTTLRYVWVATEYKDVAKQLIHDLKFGYKRQAAEVIADYLQDAVPYLEESIVLHVPTASKRVRQRGYDQSALIAKSFASKCQLAYVNVLRRSGQTRQVGAKRDKRRHQLEGAFWLSNEKLVKGRAVILIDDVSTTGSTIEVVARAVKAAGAKSVCAAVFAQAK